MKQRSGKTTHPRAVKPSDWPQTKLTCYRCGETHLASQCKFRTAEYHRCHKTGHIAKMCKSRPDVKSHHSGKRANHYLEEIPDLPDTKDLTYGLFTLQSETHDPIVDLTVLLSEWNLILDSKASYELIAQPWQAALEQPMVNLRTFTGEAVKMLGSTTVEVKYGEQCTHLTVHVVDGKGPNLLGRDWLTNSILIN